MKLPTVSTILAAFVIMLNACQNTNPSTNQSHTQTISKNTDKPLNSLQSHAKKPLSLTADNLLGEWQLVTINNQDGTPSDLPTWQNLKKPYTLSIHGDMLGQYSLSMPNDCNQISVPFAITQTGIRPNFQQVITTHAKCDTPLDDKNADESRIHDAIYYGKYQLFVRGDKSLLTIDRKGVKFVFERVDE